MEPRITLDSDQSTRLFGQTLGQHSRTGTDLHHEVLWSDIRRTKDQVANRRGDEETLSETSFRQQMVLPEQRPGLMPERRRSI